jgi:hypothetical protein
VLVVLGLPASRTPATGLHPGDQIMVVLTPSADAAAPDSVPDRIPAHVARVGDPDPNGITPVDVYTTYNDGATLATWAATGRIAIVVQPPGQE